MCERGRGVDGDRGAKQVAEWEIKAGSVLTEVEELAHVGKDLLGVHADNAVGDLLDGVAHNVVAAPNGKGHALALEP